MHVPEPGTADASGIELADGRRLHGFVDAGYGGVMEGGARRAAVVAMREGGYGDARARDLTAVHAAIGA